MKNANSRTFFFAFLCFLTGFSIFFYKAFVAGFPLAPDQNVKSWHVETKMTLYGDGSEGRVELKLPDPGESFTLLDEGFISDGYGFYVDESNGGTRQAVWTKRKPKEKETLFYRAVVYETKSPDRGGTLDDKKIRKKYLENRYDPRLQNGPSQIALQSLHQEFLSKSSDDFSYATAALKTLLNPNDERVKLIRAKLGHRSDRVSAATAVLRHGRIPARTVNLLQLSTGARDANILRRTEAFIRGNWIRFDADKAVVDKTFDIMPWWIGDDKVWRVPSGVKEIALQFEVKQHLESALTEAIWDGDGLKSLFYTSSIFGLPVDIQLTLQILLLIPLGAFACAFFKQFIGIPTYGTFMPVLIAMSFRETQLLWGITLFWLIIGLGMAFRAIFDKLQLLMVPRLSAILTVVVVIIYALSLFLFKFKIQSGLAVSLFPLVILTMIIERMSVTWEERGAKTAFQLAFNSLIVSCLCYFVISNPYAVHLTVTFPELLIVIVGLCLALGRYNGFKLLEYYRFRALK